MHIMEGFLPLEHALGWTAASAPFFVWGLKAVGRRLRDKPEQRMLIGVAAAFTFVLSALKIPSVTGSSSHPTGTGLGAILFGPLLMVPIGTVVLLFQALLLAHGGLTTLGANVFAMAIAGPFAAAGIYRAARTCRLSWRLAVFFAAALADLVTYLFTSLQLALAFPEPSGGVIASFVKIAAIFAFTQVPLAISEGLLTVLLMNAVARFNQEEFVELNRVTVREAQA